MVKYADNLFRVMTTQSSILTSALTAILNRLADKAVRARQQLQSHADKSVCFRVGSLIRLNVTIRHDGYFMPARGDEITVATMNIPAELLPRLAAGDLSAFGEISVCGDPVLTDILLYMGKILHPGIEEDLSSIVGDIFARRAMSTGQGLIRWHLESAHNLSRALAEFLTEEQPMAANRIRFRQFVSEVESLQQHAARLEKRILSLVSSFSPTAEPHPPRAGR